MTSAGEHLSPVPPSSRHVLSGVRILDLTRAIAGPACTNLMAEMGAEVIKIEGAPHGDLVRAFSVYRNGRSIFYVQQNRGKKSVCVDLRTERGRALLADLVPHVDVVVENYRPGMLEKLGLAYPRLAELKPDIVLCSISAFGQEGALATRPGYDYIAQAYSGITSMIGDPDDSPCIPTVAIGDVSTGTHAALGAWWTPHGGDPSGAYRLECAPASLGRSGAGREFADKQPQVGS